MCIWKILQAFQKLLYQIKLILSFHFPQTAWRMLERLSKHTGELSSLTVVSQKYIYIYSEVKLAQISHSLPLQSISSFAYLVLQPSWTASTLNSTWNWNSLWYQQLHSCFLTCLPRMVLEHTTIFISFCPNNVWWAGCHILSAKQEADGK